jgi:hypothetical protein
MPVAPSDASAQARGQRPSGVRLNVAAPQPRQSSPGAADHVGPARARKATGSVMRAANIALRSAADGGQIDLLASGPERGVLQFKEGRAPGRGSRLLLVSEDPLFRTMQLVARVLGPEDGLDPRAYAAVEWVHLGSGGYRQLSTALQRVLALDLPAMAGADQPLEEGALLIYDVQSSQVSVALAAPVEYQRRQSNTQNRIQTVQPKRRRVIEISSKRGDRPDKPRNS